MERSGLRTTVVGVGTAAAVFAVMFWIVDAGEVIATMRRADPVLLGVVAGTILLWNVSWGMALWNVLRGLDISIPVRLAVLINAAGAFANHVTPFGQAGGEPVTAWLLTRTVDAEYEVSLASIASLDAINVVPSLTFATVGALYFVTVDTGNETLGTLSIGILAVGTVLPGIAVVGWRYRHSVGDRVRTVTTPVVYRVTEFVPGVSTTILAAVGERLAGFHAAIERIAVNRRRLCLALSLSALGWAFQAVGLWVTFLALETSIALSVPFFVLPVGKFGSVFPTPGGLGGTEAINVTLLTILTGAGGATIVAAVTIHSVGGYVLTTSVGAAATGILGVRE